VGKEKEQRYEIKFINVQGLTNEKYTEIYREIDEMTIMCLIETQKKVDNIRVGHHLKVINSMREMEDRRGGGIMTIYEENRDKWFDKIDSKHRDCMVLKGRLGREKVNLTIVYLRTGNDRAVVEQNREVLMHVMRGVEEAEYRGEVYIMIGDFNGHLGYLGYQEENENGKEINKFIEESGLLLMNIDEKCEGLYTWERGESKSAIDLVLINERGYGLVEGVKIDDERERLDISDHCMAVLIIKIK